MSIWEDCTMTTAYLDQAAADIGVCDVRIDDSSIVVSYYDDEFGDIIYRGKNDDSGHYALKCDGRPNWSATLHRFHGDFIFEGYWIEEGYEGFWRIELNE
jgi:hypothetical protein